VKSNPSTLTAWQLGRQLRGQLVGQLRSGEAQDHGAGVGPNCPAPVGTARPPVTCELPGDVRKQTRTAQLVTVRHARDPTLNPQVRDGAQRRPDHGIPSPIYRVSASVVACCTLFHFVCRPSQGARPRCHEPPARRLTETCARPLIVVDADVCRLIEETS
jgi:hypothetical protein